MYQDRYTIHDLAEAQRRSYVRFLTSGLKYELACFSCFRAGWLELVFHPSTSRIRLPRERISEMIRKRNNVTIPMYVAASLIDRSTGEVVHSWMPLSKIPLLFGAGSFLYRGVHWTIVHQMIRAPGPYQEVSRDKNKPHITLLCEIGSRMNIQYSRDYIDWKKLSSINWKKFSKLGIIFPKNSVKSKVRKAKPRKVEIVWGREESDRLPVELFLPAIGVARTFSPSLDSETLTFRSNQINSYKQALSNLLDYYMKLKEDNSYFSELSSSKGRLDAEFLSSFDNSDNITYLSNRISSLKGLNRKKITKDSNFKRPLARLRRSFAPVLGCSDAVKTGYIGRIGRMRLNSRYGLDPNGPPYITGHDLALLSNEFSNEYVPNQPFKQDDRDNLMNRHLRSSGDLIQACWRCGFIKGQKDLLLKLTNLSKRKVGLRQILHNSRVQVNFNLTPNKFVDTFRRPIEEEIRIFVTTSPLSQWHPGTNALDDLAHPRRCTSLGPAGLSRDRATIEVRNIHPSHFGRLCSIETPEGKNVGVVNSLALGARADKYGFVLAPYIKVQNKTVAKTTSPSFLHPTIDAKGTWVAANDIFISPAGELSNRRQRSRYKKRFSAIAPHLIDWFGATPPQMLSASAALIPFVEHNDGNRALMGSNMQRQALPLMRPERPIVGTGLEPIVATDSRSSIRAIASGYVYWVSSHEIRVHSILHWRKNKFSTIKYNLGRYKSTQRGTFTDHSPWVTEGEWVQTGDLIADGAGCHKGDLSLGRNLLVAYMPWEGYNYEDAVTINQRLVDEDLMTSIHIKSYSLTLPEVDPSTFKDSDALPSSLTGHYDLIHGEYPGTFLGRLGVPLKHRRILDRDGIVHLGAWVEPGSVLIGVIELLARKKPVSGARKLVIDIFGDQEARRYKDHSLRVPRSIKGRVVGLRGSRPSWSRLVTTRSKNSTIYPSVELRVLVAQRCRIRVGDKIAGRHGNKGVIARILPRQDMPYLASGLTVDIILNPLGVPSRMNVGQIYEGLLGLAGRILGQQYRVLPFDEIYGSEASYGLVYGKLLEARQRLNVPWIFNPQAPGKTCAFDGRTGEPLEQMVLLTTSYILKLEHRVDEKIHARTTGPYSLLTQQPVRGRSRKGGQRLGEMEVWALEGFGASYTLHEMMTTKSDDIELRRAMSLRLAKGIYGFKPPYQTQPETFKLLMVELRALCLKLMSDKDPASDF
uniref:DNA-directed RNA polymerase subunit beta n=1 Tax=Chloroparvula sp. RCC696 TaxID=2565275 RepID=A0A4D6C1Z2_9CHLO|nr:beta subunit of RNA polymerase [Chloroparvula sp. RCC696]